MADEVKADPQIIKQLRDRTCLPLMKCKELVQQANNDLEKAMVLAREDYYKNRPRWAYLDGDPR